MATAIKDQHVQCAMLVTNEIFSSQQPFCSNSLCDWKQKPSQKRFIFCLALNIPFECTLFNTFHFKIPNSKRTFWILQLVAAASKNKTLEFTLFWIFITLTWSWGERRLFLLFCCYFLFAFCRGNDNDSCLLFDKINWMSSSLRFNIALHWRRENMIVCFRFEVVHRIQNQWQQKLTQ